MTRILVTGSRYWPYNEKNRKGMVLFDRTISDYLRKVNQYDDEYGMPTGTIIVVHGDCETGMDRIAADWCRANFVNDEPHPAKWKEHGKAAGPIRNSEMVALGADMCLAFPILESPGTYDCTGKARKAGIPIIITSPERED